MSGVTAVTRSRVLELLQVETEEHRVQDLRGDRPGSRSSAESSRSGKPARRSVPARRPLPLQPPHLVHDQPQRLAGRFGAGVGFGDDGARILQGIEIGRGAVGQAGPSAARGAGGFPSPPRILIARSRAIVGCFRGSAVLPTRISVCTAPGRSMMTSRRVDRRCSACAAALAGLASLRRALRAGKRLVGRHVADDGQDGVVRAEPGAVKGDEIVTGDAGERCGVPESGRPCRCGP